VSDSKILVDIQPVYGIFSGQLSVRQYQIRLQNSYPAAEVKVNSKVVDYCPLAVELGYQKDCWWYEGNSLSIMVGIINRSISDLVNIEITSITSNVDSKLVSGFAKKMKRLFDIKQILDNQFSQIYQEEYPNILNAGETGERINYDVTTAVTEIRNFEALYNSAINDVKNLDKLDKGIKQIVLAQLQS